MPDYRRLALLPRLEQYARLKVWIGRFRFYQASQDRETEASEELQSLSHRVFHQLKWLSREYEPGYIEAFRQDFSTDWARYIAEAQEQLAQAIESTRRVRDAEPQPRALSRSDERRSNSTGVDYIPATTAWHLWVATWTDSRLLTMTVELTTTTERS